MRKLGFGNSVSASAILSFLEREHSSILCGSAFWLIIFTMLIGQLMLPSGTPDSSVLLFWKVSLASSIVATGGLFFIGKMGRAPLNRAVALYVVCGLSVVAAVALLLRESSSLEIIASSSILVGLATAIYGVLLCESFASKTLRDAMITVGFQQLLASALFAGFYLIESKTSIGVCLASFSVLCLTILKMKASQNGTTTAEDRQSVEEGRLPAFRPFLGLLAFVGLTYGITQALTKVLIGDAPRLLFLEVGGTFLSAVIVIACCGIVRGRESNRGYLMVVLVLIASGFATTPLCDYGIMVSPLIYYAGFSYCYASLFFAVPLFAGARPHRRAVELFAPMLLSMQIGQAMGAVAESLPLDRTSAFSFAGLVLYAVFMIAVVAFNTQGGKAKRRSGISSSATLEARCGELALRYGLTPRETTILNMLAEGKSNTEIQNSLVLSKDTVKSHIRNIYKKLDIHSRPNLYRLINNLPSQ